MTTKMICKYQRFQKLCELMLFLFLRIEYTDCFGRSRKILKKDLDKVKEQDEDLTDVVESREQNSKRDGKSRSPGEISKEESNSEEEMIGPDIGLAFMKQKQEWQIQEDINQQGTTLTYQDILFDGLFL